MVFLEVLVNKNDLDMKKQSFLHICCIILIINYSCISQSSNDIKRNYGNTEIERLLKNKDSTLLFLASQFIYRIDNKDLTINRNDLLIEKKNILDSLRYNQKWQSDFNKLNKFALKDKLFENKINKWCSIYNIFNFELTLERFVVFDKIIYEIELTNPLFNKYLNNDRQDWSSLSSLDSYNIFYDTISFLSLQDEQVQINFFIEYFKALSHKD